MCQRATYLLLHLNSRLSGLNGVSESHTVYCNGYVSLPLFASMP
jgi:hypothetical protein